MAPLHVLMCGTGEYTTGLVGDGSVASTSDKKIGVVALTLFDLRRRGRVGPLAMVGTNGGKFPAIRKHFEEKIKGRYREMDVSFEAYPRGDQRDPKAYERAIDALPRGSAVIIFTPDPTHLPIALYAIEHGHHVLVTKPAVKTVAEHEQLVQAARKAGVFVMVEHHKRFDPSYRDARVRASELGEPSFFSSYMTQPKSQLETFKAWAGKDSDISYYLNSHHIDIHSWIVGKRARPTRVTASAARGIATGPPYDCPAGTEDSITLLVDWQSAESDDHTCTAIYTASWTAVRGAGVHSEQRFHYVGTKGDVQVDQARRGYTVTTDADGLSSVNPFYMTYTPDDAGYFAGQSGYGYVSIETFIDACTRVEDEATAEGRAEALRRLEERGLPTIRDTLITTAILEAGRRSLDERRSINLRPTEDGSWRLS